MTAAERQLFLASRVGQIGGSNMGSLLSHILPMQYGCQRNLWANLSGVPTDNPESESEFMALGNVIEPWIRRAYCDRTGRTVAQHGLKKHDTIAGLQYHDDGIITPAPSDTRNSPGILECKGIGQQMLYKVENDGLPLDYVAQVQAGLAAHGDNFVWGSFAVAVREDIIPLIAIEQAALLAGDPMPKLPRRPKLVHFDVERSQDIIDAIEEEAPRFLATIGKEPPVRLDQDDPRCARCPRKSWCWGEHIAAGLHERTPLPERADLLPLAEEYRANVALLKQCEELVEETEARFKEALGTETAVKVGGKNVIYRMRKGAERVDGRSMAVQYDQLRRMAVAAGIPGAELVPVSAEYAKIGAPSRPLLLSSLLPKKNKELVPEVDEPIYS